jgi:single-strand DNA-binding protein
MARGVNSVHLIGNLGNDPETKYTQGGMAITRISLATTSVRKDKEGNAVESTQWHRVVFFGKLAEIAGEYLKKGSTAYVQGSIKYDKYTGSDGVEKYTTDIIADSMQMLGGRAASAGGERGPSRTARSEGCSSNAGSSRSPMAPPPADDFSDDDIPF